MAKSGARRLTALAYFMLMSIGVTFSLAGVTTREIARTFAVDSAVIGYVFTLFSVGYSLAILGNGWLLDKVNVGREAAAAAAAAALAVLAATMVPYLAVFAAGIFLYGVGLGVLCSVGYDLIVNLYDDEARAAKLNLLNFFFGVGAVASPLLAGLALQYGASWQSVFQATLPLLALTAAGGLSLPRVRRPAPAGERGEGEGRWGSAVYVIGLALLCYVVSEMVFAYWVVVYMIEGLKMEVAVASVSLSVFWALMAAGRLAAGRLIEWLGIRRYIIISAAAAFAAFAVLLTVGTPWVALALVAVMGLGYSGVYATILTYGTLQVLRPSARLTTFFLAIGAAGGILSFLLSSWLKQVFDVWTVLAVAATLMGAVAVLVWLVGRKKPTGGE